MILFSFPGPLSGPFFFARFYPASQAKTIKKLDYQDIPPWEKGKPSSKSALGGDILVPWRVIIVLKPMFLSPFKTIHFFPQRRTWQPGKSPFSLWIFQPVIRSFSGGDKCFMKTLDMPWIDPPLGHLNHHPGSQADHFKNSHLKLLIINPWKASCS